MKVILRRSICGDNIEIKKCLIGYAVYDSDEFESWCLTLKGAMKRAQYLCGGV